MPDDERLARAQELMNEFAQRTGLCGAEGAAARTRYLWTDAFAVGNFLGLARTTGEERWLELALELIEQVHAELGHHRADDPRDGRLGDATEAHPTRGGLRIGKSLPERPPGEPIDQRREWDRDGQYFHYLTKWMHALDLTTRQTGEARFSRWARELDETAHEAFTYAGPGGVPRMYWKLSIDLSRPQVPSMGHHDPLDGYVTTVQLERTADALGGAPDLENERESFAAMMNAAGRLATDDPLGLGGLLIDAYRVEQLRRRGFDDPFDLLTALLEGARVGLAAFARGFDPTGPASRRLGFRELGLAIGLHGIERMATALESGTFGGSVEAAAAVRALERYLPLAHAIEQFWLETGSRQQSTWTEHRDINDVMLATSLAPAGVLELGVVERSQ